MLHIVNKSPFEKSSLESCLRLALPGDAILLIEDAVVAATKSTSIAESLVDALQTRSIFVLAEDLAARGIDTERLLEGIRLVDYSGFVDLVASHDVNQSWL